MFDEVLSYTNFSAVLVFLLVFLVTYITWTSTCRNGTNIPGPAPWPILGNYPLILGSIQNPTKMFLDLQRKYGDIVYMSIGSQPIILCFGYKMVRTILVSNGNKTKFRPSWLHVYKKIFLNGKSLGIVISDGDEWSRGRKFTMRALKDFGDGQMESIIHQEIGFLFAEISKQGNLAVDVRNIFSKLASNVISNVIFGTRYNYNDSTFNKFLEDIIFVIEQNTLFRPDNFFPILDRIISSKKSAETFQRLDQVRKFIRMRIDESRETFDITTKRSLIDFYLEDETKSESKISENLLYSAIHDFIGAGSDTVSVILQWSMLYMLNYPDVQRKCHQEILEVIGPSRLPELSDKDRLPYVNATLHEIQRIATTTPFGVPHATLEDVCIDGKVIPKKSIILCDLMSVHMDPTVWDNPEEFRPQRFLGKDGSFVSKDAYCPFSLGPRICLGKQLGESEVFLFFTAILQKFSVTKENPDVTLSTDGVLTFATLEPLPFKVHFNKADKATLN